MPTGHPPIVPQWQPDTWRNHPVAQQPDWPDVAAVADAERRLLQLPPLVTPEECRALTAALAEAADGRALVLQAGDCAERFTETASTEARARLVEALANRLMTATGLPVVAIGRMAGQYAKPRSSSTEEVSGPDGPLTVPSYRGDLVNGPDPDSRDPDPGRLVEGYHRAAATLALLRARSTSTSTGPRPATDVFVSHEALLLPFEEALTRYDCQAHAWYATSAHLLWIGDRTRGLDQAHVEYLRGIANPVAVKLGPTTTADDVVALCQKLNPERVPGRLTLITRMGARQVSRLLPEMIEAVTRAKYPVVWVCDPMHANTTTTAAGFKTRHLDTMLAEAEDWLAAHHATGSHPGGLHLEVTCDNVTECIGGPAGAANEDQVHQHFLSACDPRLNPEQAGELIAQTGRLIRHRSPKAAGSTSAKTATGHWRPYAQERHANLTEAATTHTWTTTGRLEITRIAQPYPHHALDQVTAALDERPGGVLGSGVQQPGRYRRWRIGYVAPCLEVTVAARRVNVRALNERGRVLLPIVAQALSASGHLTSTGSSALTLVVPAPADVLLEEQRSRRSSVFSALRALLAAFAAPDDVHLGLYGAFGYDLAFGFESITLRRPRPDDHRDLVLHLPDELYVEDEFGVIRYRYDFTLGDTTTAGLPRDSDRIHPATRPPALPPPPRQGDYAKVVRTAQEHFARGDLVEVVPSHVMYAPCTSASDFYDRLRRRNPAPYELLFNLDGEHLAGTSPEMYARVTRDDHGRLWVETCPISGTIRRGRDAVEDSDHVRTLLNSGKDESELTMCTDVDRNDKARICDPGSVQILGRRQIEMYSRLIHTVDHVRGRLRPGFDALDAFLTHMWAVTVTGAPKRAAMQFIEDHEQSPRRWYGGAVGVLRFDGTLDSGLTLRTAQIRDGLAAVRVGATLLHDSDPDAEERETQVKAQALMETLTRAPRTTKPDTPPPPQTEAIPMRVLLIDHRDSFVHTLADYFRQAGAQVITMRAGLPSATLDELTPDLVVLSPGPGRPGEHGCLDLLNEITARGLPAFGVCLGLQAMIEHSGGTIVPLPEPAHGRPSSITVHSGHLLTGLPPQFTAGRYHSLHAAQVPDCYEISATTDDGVVMAIEHRHAPRWAVQFHPESLMTTDHNAGRRIIANVLRLARAHQAARAPLLEER